jgi:hypothetical protein
LGTNPLTEDWVPLDAEDNGERTIVSKSEEGVGRANPPTEDKQAMTIGAGESPHDSNRGNQSVKEWDSEVSSQTAPDRRPQKPRREQAERKEDAVTLRRDAKRLIRATKKIAYQILRETPNVPKVKEQRPERKIIKIYLTMMDRVRLRFLKHWDGMRREVEVEITKGPWDIRKYLVRTISRLALGDGLISQSQSRSQKRATISS